MIEEIEKIIEKKIVKYPCSVCKKPTNIELLKKIISDDLIFVTFRTECCKKEFNNFFSKHDFQRYIGEI